MEMRDKITEVIYLVESAKERVRTSINPKTGKMYISDQGCQETYDEILEQTTDLLESIDQSIDEEAEQEALEEFLNWIIARKDAVMIEEADEADLKKAGGLRRGVLQALKHLEDLLLEQGIQMPDED